jgi:hypothetical protein
MTKTKGKRVTKAMIEAQSELLVEIAKRRGISRQYALYEAVKAYTWTWMQERGKQLKEQIKRNA